MAAKRGIFEREKGSGIWWIRWTDANGRERREKAGNRSAAEKLLARRHTQKLEGVKLPENLRLKTTSFQELCEDALIHSKAENSDKQTYELRLRISQILPAFGSRPADSIRKNEIVSWLTEQSAKRNWAASSQNRWQATFSLIFRVGIDNEKIERNPAARIRRKTESNRRVRFLSQDEEIRLRKAIERRFPEFLPHQFLSIHTGMRMSEQYSLRWNQIDFERRQITSCENQEWASACHSAERDRASGAEATTWCWKNRRERPGISIGAQWGYSPRITRLVSQRSRRGRDRRVHLALQPAHFCQ